MTRKITTYMRLFCIRLPGNNNSIEKRLDCCVRIFNVLRKVDLSYELHGLMR